MPTGRTSGHSAFVEELAERMGEQDADATTDTARTFMAAMLARDVVGHDADSLVAEAFKLAERFEAEAGKRRAR